MIAPSRVVTKSRKRPPLATGKHGDKGRFVTLKTGRVIFLPEGKRTKWADVKDGIIGGQATPVLAIGRELLLERGGFNSHRRDLCSSFEREFPQALKAAGVSPDDIEEMRVFGSFSSKKPKPGDLDILILVSEGADLPNGETVIDTPVSTYKYDDSSWAQHERVCPMTFVNNRQMYEAVLETMQEEAPEWYDEPGLIYTKALGPLASR